MDAPEQPVEPVAPDATTPADDDGPTAVPELRPADQDVHDGPVLVDFHGLACEDGTRAAWDTLDPCGGTACDWVLLRVSCGLITAPARPYLCLAKAEDGTWTDCQAAWTARVGRDGLELGQALLDATGVQIEGFSLLPEVTACARLPDTEGPVAGLVDVAPEGLFLDLGGITHTACAAPEDDGVWGGSPRVPGTARVPVDAGCLGATAGLGWRLVEEDGEAFVEVANFGLVRESTGTFPELTAILGDPTR